MIHLTDSTHYLLLYPEMNFLYLGSYLWPIILLQNSRATLLSKCSSDADCDVVHGYCHSGVCTCQPFFARYNSTCVPSRLLDEECMTEEQCTMKVAQSTCSGGKCKCSFGFLQFRHHTCLSAAKPGDVCLNNEHCKLWSKNSHCQYLIPNLIGRCACSSHTRLFGSSCFTDEEVANFNRERTTESSDEILSSIKSDTEEEIRNGGAEKGEGAEEQPNEETNEYVYKAKVPSEKDPSVSDPFYDQKKHHLEKGNSDPVATDVITVNAKDGSDEEGEENKAGTELEDGDHFQETTQVTQQNISDQNEINYNESAEATTFCGEEMPSPGKEESDDAADDGDYLKHWKNKDVISLGLPCVSDEQCKAADVGSRCINNVCDCSVKGNKTDECSGCGPKTFQCRSSGICLSWFFVCDGKTDCSDGSDEECSGSPCPMLSFQCGKEGICVSRSTLCDGIKNCPNGEDELLCGRDRGNCPENSFRCENGRCLPEYEFCNAIPACSDGSDELEEVCGAQFSEGRPRKAAIEDNCPFRCKNGRCRSTAILCSGRDGCGDGSDEQRCTVCRCPSEAQ